MVVVTVMTDDSFIMSTYFEKEENMCNNIILYIIL